MTITHRCGVSFEHEGPLYNHQFKCRGCGAIWRVAVISKQHVCGQTLPDLQTQELRDDKWIPERTLCATSS